MTIDLPRHLEGQEQSPPLFPDLLDGLSDGPDHVWSVATAFRPGRNGYWQDMLCVNVHWDKPNTYVPDLPPWVVLIKRYRYRHIVVREYRKHARETLDMKSRWHEKRFQYRAEAVAYATKLKGIFEAYETRRRHAAENPTEADQGLEDAGEHGEGRPHHQVGQPVPDCVLP